ncbi:uncharacterized protein BP01DRAFT_172808 [Aspergillus saccharolyticus JOP 1030-1]|uniref:Uncharacterized protein n=1 Tax=Aspergillus saccharolyticus JOP 1030-1 TaxID=1450539 RepID=A0A318Z1Z2_9EURO|nr:hypothetical protein BP01DRAFT_172808 [Aspergillus saccharolyticus JOP 1030-1]PYH41305.1 hypothetical protein BP01DRAFT_172808 [Aspergillus saccharolyticus JOP 1030-1]
MKAGLFQYFKPSLTPSLLPSNSPLQSLLSFCSCLSDIFPCVSTVAVDRVKLARLYTSR